MTLGGLVALLNWYTVYYTWRSGRFCSPIPLIGGFFLGGGMLLLPALRSCAWLALVLDYGTLAFLLAIPAMAREMWSTSRINLLEEYAAQVGKKSVQLRLFRKGVFTLKRQLRRQPGELGLMGASTIGAWKREGNRLQLSLYENSAIFAASPGAEQEALVLESGACGYENTELALAGMELRLKYRRAPRF
jgi:hypothetical protein